MNEQHPSESAVALCASCDRCRTRKTKCDGARPCSNCANKYMKRNKVQSIEGVPYEDFDCVYSPAKRRGPIPGRTANTSKKVTNSAQQLVGQTRSADWLQSGGGGMFQQMAASGDGMVDPAQLAAFLSANAGGANAGGANGFGAAAMPNHGNMQQQQQQQQQQQPPETIQQQLRMLQQQMQQQQIQQQHGQQQATNTTNTDEGAEPSAQRIKKTVPPGSQPAGIPRTIMEHTHLLERGDPEGSRLRAYFKMSIDELFRLPPTPTDEEFCARLKVPGLTPQMIPGIHLAALSASRFAEVSLGALVHNEVSLAMELCNAVVHCLRESVQEPVEMPVMFEVAKAYFLLGVFRAYRGDMDRYFKYRRVCFTYLSRLEESQATQILLAAVSYLDSWAYMIYNADETGLPDVDSTIPPVQMSSDSVQQQQQDISESSDSVEKKYNIKTDLCSIACDPRNKNWIQGAPPVYLNNEAPLHSRVLDALACAVRTCCDQANHRFATLAKENGDPMPSCGPGGCRPLETPTSTAVLAHENELCSRNIVLSAFTLMQQSEAVNKQHGKLDGQHVVISAMDAFLENNDENMDGGFTDSQVQSLLSVCNTVVENPFLLFHAGPTYHMISNAAILLCHLLNGMHAMKSKDQFGPMEATMFEEVVDTFVSIRKLLTIHRRKLPVKLRCHGIPRPSLDGVQEGQPFVDLGETLLCPCRGCQGFVLMACSPCVAAERARSSAARMEVAEAQEAEAADLGELGNMSADFGAEFDLDDDALLDMISGLIQA